MDEYKTAINYYTLQNSNFTTKHYKTFFSLLNSKQTLIFKCDDLCGKYSVNFFVPVTGNIYRHKKQKQQQQQQQQQYNNYYYK